MQLNKYDIDTLKNVLLPYSEFHPFPRRCERKQWEELPHELKDMWIKTGEEYLEFGWPTLTATLFMDFKRTGNRTRFEERHMKRRHALVSLVLAECMEGKKRFMDQILNGIWVICEETFWGVPAHNIVSKHPGAPLPDVTEPIISLLSVETANLLSWTYYLLKEELDDITPVICERIKVEIKRRILDPYLQRNDFWWMGFAKGSKVNNWNPWCNSGCLSSFLFIDEDDERRVQAVQKILGSLQVFVDTYHEDGGCEEGTTYWWRAGGALFDCLELLYWASDRKINYYDEDLIKQIGRYIYRAHIHEDYFINFGDGSAKVVADGALLYRYGLRIEDRDLIDMGISAFHLHKDTKPPTKGDAPTLLRKLPELFIYEEIDTKKAEPPYIQDIWFNGIQVMAARQKGGDYKGFYLAAKGGHNGESHNHNDVGQFIVYYNGYPLIIDIGVETYTAKTFSSSRYEIWTMQSQYHNLPTVNGICQHEGEEFRALDVSYLCDESMAELSMDIAKAYPSEAGIKKWFRRCILHRKEDDGALCSDVGFNTGINEGFDSNLGMNPITVFLTDYETGPAIKTGVEIMDEFELEHESGDIMISLLISCENTIDNERGKISLQHKDKDLTIFFDRSNFSCNGDYIPITDELLQNVWGDHVYRIVFRAKKPMGKGVWHIIISNAD